MQFNFSIHDHHAWPESQALLLHDVRVAMSAARERRPTLTRIELGNMSMATAARAPCADSFFESAMTQSRRGGIPDLISLQNGLDPAAVRGRAGTSRQWIAGRISVALDVVVACARTLASKLLMLCAISCAIAVSGCAKNTTQRKVMADPAQITAPAAPAAPVRRHSEVRIRRPNRSLLVPQSAPDCEFRRPDLKTVDPDEWARLKLDYQRQCYQEAEQTVRNRLRLLQASSKCEIVR
jgi:hypothetical protein